MPKGILFRRILCCTCFHYFKEDAMPGKRSSADLLKSIYLRKEKMLEPDNPETATAEFQNYPSLEARLRPRLAVGDRFEELAEDVKTFFIVNDGRASTEQVLTKFKASF